jgi:hypothetical protein
MLRPSAFSYQIAVQHSTTINVASDDCLFVVCLLALTALRLAQRRQGGRTPKSYARRRRIGASQIL